MIDTIIAIIAMALLFVLFGTIKYRSCTGHCAGCTNACGRDPEGDQNVE